MKENVKLGKYREEQKIQKLVRRKVENSRSIAKQSPKYIICHERVENPGSIVKNSEIPVSGEAEQKFQEVSRRRANLEGQKTQEVSRRRVENSGIVAKESGKSREYREE